MNQITNKRGIVSGEDKIEGLCMYARPLYEFHTNLRGKKTRIFQLVWHPPNENTRSFHQLTRTRKTKSYMEEIESTKKNKNQPPKKNSYMILLFSSLLTKKTPREEDAALVAIEFKRLELSSQPNIKQQKPKHNASFQNKTIISQIEVYEYTRREVQLP